MIHYILTLHNENEYFKTTYLITTKIKLNNKEGKNNI